MPKGSLTSLRDAAVRSRMAKEILETEIRAAVERGEYFVDIAKSIDRTEGAVRLKAGRKKWYTPGERRGNGAASMM